MWPKWLHDICAFVLTEVNFRFPFSVLPKWLHSPSQDCNSQNGCMTHVQPFWRRSIFNFRFPFFIFCFAKMHSPSQDFNSQNGCMTHVLSFWQRSRFCASCEEEAAATNFAQLQKIGFFLKLPKRNIEEGDAARFCNNELWIERFCKLGNGSALLFELSSSLSCRVCQPNWSPFCTFKLSFL